MSTKNAYAKPEGHTFEELAPARRRCRAQGRFATLKNRRSTQVHSRALCRTLALSPVLLVIPHAAPAAGDAVRLVPCEIQGVASGALCGTHEVYEDRRAKTGRRLALKIVVLSATGAAKKPDPVFFINGGPGESATGSAAGMAQSLSPIRETRDIVLVDQRGTGGSNPLACDLFGGGDDVATLLGDYFPPAAVKACRAALEKKADLRLYTTPVAMDDLDNVRAALGYERINLFGGSYGTRASLAYLRQHPRSVRTATIQGVAPTTIPMPRHFARDAQRALDGVLGECAREATCAAAFPRLGEETRGLLSALQKAPARVEVAHPETGAPVSVSLSRDLAAEAMRYLLYDSGMASFLPVVLHEAASGDPTALAEFALFGRREIVSSGAQGLYLSVTCAEDLPFVPTEEGLREAKGTFLGDYRLRQQKAACAVWPRGAIPKGYRQAVRSEAPVLAFSGQWDPVTPPAQAEGALKTLPRSHHVVVEHGGHSYGGLGSRDCPVRIMAAFIEHGSAEGLDTSCIASMHRPPFPTSLPPMKPVRLLAEEIQRFAGRYASDKGGNAIVEAATSGLRIAFDEERPFLVIPVSANRFRLPGPPGVAVVFGLEGGEAKALALEQGGNEIMKLERVR